MGDFHQLVTVGRSSTYQLITTNFVFSLFYYINQYIMRHNIQFY